MRTKSIYANDPVLMRKLPPMDDPSYGEKLTEALMALMQFHKIKPDKDNSKADFLEQVVNALIFYHVPAFSKRAGRPKKLSKEAKIRAALLAEVEEKKGSVLQACKNLTKYTNKDFVEKLYGKKVSVAKLRKDVALAKKERAKNADINAIDWEVVVSSVNDLPEPD